MPNNLLPNNLLTDEKFRLKLAAVDHTTEIKKREGVYVAGQLDEKLCIIIS